jgi:hypothetical protein
MRSTLNLTFLMISILSFTISCNEDKFAKIQGIYKVDKELLKDQFNKKNDKGLNALASSLISAAIQNSTIEFQIVGDSIKGLIFVMGNGSTINSKIITRNDSLVVNTGESESYLFLSEKGLNLLQPKSGFNFTLLKTDQLELSQETKIAIDNIKKKEQEEKEFDEKIGKWQIGNYVDEFGDNVDKKFAYSFVKGSHENSLAKLSDVYIKVMKEENSLYFSVYNNGLTMKENLPDSEFGSIKIKFPDGTIKSERVFFFNNSFSESPDDKNSLIYSHIMSNSSPLKIQLDLSSASSYYTDKYVFELEQTNLLSILKDVDNSIK